MKKKVLLPVAIFFIILAGIVIVRTDLLKPVILDASYPLLFTVEKLKEYGDYVTDFIRSKDDLIEKNEKFEREIELLKAQLIELRYVQRENSKLREITNFVRKYPEYTYITAKVIGYSPDNWNRFVIINAGSSDGIKRGDIVLADGRLLGQVYQVGAFSSSVITISDKNFRISARCRNTEEAVFFQGKNLKEGILLFVRPEQDIRIGDIVETYGSNSGTPPGIPIGVIKSVSYVEGNFYKDVKVSINTDMYKINYVVVITGRKK